MRAKAQTESRLGRRARAPTRDATPGHRTRILVVDAAPRGVAAVRKILCAQDWEVISAQTGAEALQKARYEGCDAIVAGFTLADMSAPDLCRALSERAETMAVPVIVLSAGAGVAERVASLRAGASDYLVKPPDARELVARLQAALDLRSRSTGFVVGVVGGKGGVGTSLLAVNLAVALRRHTRASIVLLDAAMRVDAVDVMLNLHAAHGLRDLLPRLDDLEAADFESVLINHASGVQVLLLRDEMLTPVRPEEMRRLLVALRRMRDFVVVDTPSLLDDSTVTTLELADLVLLILTPEITSLRGATLLMRRAEEVGLSRDRIMPVLNRFPQRGGLPLGAIEKALGLSLRGIIPDDSPLVTYSINRGVPLVESHGRSRVAQQMDELAKGLFQVAQQQVISLGGYQPER